MKHLPKRYPAVLTACLAIAFLTCQVSAGKVSHSISVDTSSFSMETLTSPTGENFSRLVSPSCGRTYVPGAPDMPVQRISFLVPTYSNEFKVSLSYSGEYYEYALDNDIYPVQESRSLNEPASDKFTPIDRNAYNGISLSPTATVESDWFLDGYYHIVNVAVRPAGYDMEGNRILLYHDINVSLDFTECREDEMDAVPFVSAEPSPWHDIADFVVNPPEENRRASVSNPQLTEIRQYYLIVTQRNLVEAFEDLARWKRQKGYVTDVVAVEDILETPGYTVIAGSTDRFDKEACLRKWLIDRKKNTGLNFLLLAGDVPSGFPCRKYVEWNTVNETSINNEEYVPSDNYFADLVTDIKCTKQPMNSSYATSYMANFSPTIPVGRLLCKTTREVENYIFKLKLYESYPGYGEMDYLSQGMYFKQDEFIPCKSLFNTFSYISYEKLIKDESTCKHDYNKDKPTGETVIEDIAKSGISSWQGHGGPGSIGCTGTRYVDYGNNMHYICPMEGYTYEQNYLGHEMKNGLDCLDNIGFPSIAYSTSCEIMPFDNINDKDNIPYNMGSGFTVAGKYGGVALLSNTRNGYREPSDSLEVYFGSALLTASKIGDAENLSKTKLQLGKYWNLVRAGHNLIGDPDIELWRGTPKMIECKIGKNALSTMLQSNITNGYISLYRGDNNVSLYRFSCIGGNVVELPLPSSGIMSISLFKTGMLPYTYLYTSGNKIINTKSTFQLRSAIFTKPLSSSQSMRPVDNFPVYLNIGSNTNITINSYETIFSDTGIRVGRGGILNLSSRKDTVSKEDVVESGGVLNIESEGSVTLQSGFTVEKGGELTINCGKQ